jgi:DNA gyrase subunit B
MQPEELGETTLDIDARTLVRVTIDDFDAAGTFIGNMLHSKTVEARRQLIANTVLQSESVDA